jgi:hypothetical protein
MSQTKKAFISIFAPLILSLLAFMAYGHITLSAENNEPIFNPDFLIIFSLSCLTLSFILPFWIFLDKKPIERTELDLTED